MCSRRMENRMAKEMIYRRGTWRESKWEIEASEAGEDTHEILRREKG